MLRAKFAKRRSPRSAQGLLLREYMQRGNGRALQASATTARPEFVASERILGSVTEHVKVDQQVVQSVNANFSQSLVPEFVSFKIGQFSTMP